HAGDQPVAQNVEVGNARFGDERTVERAYGLRDLDGDGPIRPCAEGQRLDPRVDRGPLARPVLAHRRLTAESPPSQALGQSTSSVMRARTVVMSRELKARYSSASSSAASAIGYAEHNRLTASAGQQGDS